MHVQRMLKMIRVYTLAEILRKYLQKRRLLGYVLINLGKHAENEI